MLHLQHRHQIFFHNNKVNSLNIFSFLLFSLVVHEESPFFPIVSTVDQQRLDHFNPLTDQWQQQRRTTGQHHSQYSQPGSAFVSHFVK